MVAAILRCVFSLTVRFRSSYSAVLITYTLQNPQNSRTVSSWACRETFVAVVVNNAPMIRPLFSRPSWLHSSKLTNTWSSGSHTNTISSPRKAKFTDTTLLASESGSTDHISLPDRPAALMIKREATYEVFTQEADIERGEGTELKAEQLQTDFSAVGGRLFPGYSATVTGPGDSPIPSASCSRTDLNSSWNIRRGV